MTRIVLCLAALIAWCSAAIAQNVTVIGPITPGDCAFFNSTTVVKDAGFNCNGAPGGAITGLTGDGTATGPGNVPFTLATVNANVGTFGSATQCIVTTQNAKGLTTAISVVTCAPAFSSITGVATIAQGGTGQTTQQAALNAIECMPTRAGDISYWNGSNWVCFAGNNSGTQFLSENASGVPAWSAGGGGGTVAAGGTGVTNLLGLITGLQPLKLGGSVVGVNPGTWANNTGTATFNSTAVFSADLSTASINYGSTPAQGGQISGALTPLANTSDGTEVFLYLTHRISDGKIALVGSSSDTFGSSQTFTATAAAPGVFTFGAPHGFRKRMAIYFVNSGGSLPSPVTTATQYYICTVPSGTTFTIATSLANVNTGSCLTTTTTGSGTNTASWGVQNDLNFQLGAGVTTVDRRLPYFAFVWSWTKYGNAGIPGGSNGIPDFQVAQGASDTLLTGSSQAAVFQALAAGTSASFASVDLSPWLANLNRRVLIFTSCTFPSSAGGCIVRTTGGGGTGLQVGSPSTATISSNGMSTFQTDSTTHIDYEVTGGANLSIWIMGWTFVDPS
jgi:hypothetical protein